VHRRSQDVPEAAPVACGDGQQQHADDEGKAMRLDPPDRVWRVSKDIRIRPRAHVKGEQLEHDLHATDHDEKHAVGDEQPPSCGLHRLTIDT
jgi:hypothetical protein